MGLGVVVLDLVAPYFELMAPLMPGEVFPYFFTMELFQRALLAALMVTVVAGILGTYLLIQNLALIGDGLAHVSFGGVAVGVVLGATSPLWYALVFSIIAAILIHEMQARGMLSGDTSIAIFLTGMLALGLVVLRIGGGGITTDIEGYLFGNLLLIDEDSLDLITVICLISVVLMAMIRNALLAITVDPVAARIQGLRFKTSDCSSVSLRPRWWSAWCRWSERCWSRLCWSHQPPRPNSLGPASALR